MLPIEILLKTNHRSRMRLRAQICIRLFIMVVGAAMLSVWSIRAAPQTASSTLGRNDNVLYAELAKAPIKAVTRHNPLQHDPEAVAAGAKLYGLHCAECHGQTGEGGQGSKKGPSLRAGEVQQATPGTLFWVLTNGVVRRGMPVWSKLPEPQRWQLVSFVKSLGAPAKAVKDGAKP
jgi:mono/diheme cytochrome c family protein